MATGKRPLAAALALQVEEEEDEEEQLQDRKRQKLQSSDDGSEEEKETSPVKTADIDVNVKAKIPDVPLADEYRGGEFFFVRKCYAEYYLKVEALVIEKKEKCVTVTGTPGIGKSVFYAFFLDRFRKTHTDWTIVASTYTKNSKIMQLTVFEPGKIPEVYPEATEIELNEITSRLYNKGDMEAGQPNAVVDKKVLWLCDGPPDVKRRQMVVFTSPNEWLRVAKNNEQTYYMPPWTLEELQLAAFVLGYPFTDDEIQSRFWNFGGVARNCFRFNLARIRTQISYLTRPIAAIANSGDLRNLLIGTPNDDTHHRFLLYVPQEDGMDYDTEIVSDMARQKLGEQLFSVIEGNVKEVEASLKGIPEAASLRGWIFEPRAHAKLQQTSCLNARLLDEPDLPRVKIVMQPSDEIDIFQGKSISPALLNNGPYHKPKEKDFASIDGFFFPKLNGAALTMDEKVNRILLFQMTVSKSHPVQASGIIYLLEKLGVLDLVKANPKCAALVFVCPTNGSKDFKKQRILSSGTPPNEIRGLKGIGPKTVAILATYKVTSIADLEAKVDAFETGRIPMTNKKDKEAWARAAKKLKKRSAILEGPVEY